MNKIGKLQPDLEKEERTHYQYREKWWFYSHYKDNNEYYKPFYASKFDNVH